MDCPKCKCTHSCKDGIVQNRQRYLCKECNYRYTVEYNSWHKSKSTKRQALELYLEGLGFRSIGRILRISHVTVYNWIKSFGEKLDEIKHDTPIEVMELDEMHSYIGSKKNTVGYGLLLIDMGKGSSTAYWAQGEQQQE